MTGRKLWEVHHEWRQEESPEELQVRCAVGELVALPTTFDHINIIYIWGPHVNHMGTPR